MLHCEMLHCERHAFSRELLLTVQAFEELGLRLGPDEAWDEARRGLGRTKTRTLHGEAEREVRVITRMNP
jgi:hypothetical protein